MWIDYTCDIDYSHRITKENLVDNACKCNHTHPKVTINVAVKTIVFKDFKAVKAMVENILVPMRGKNITDDFGIETTEDLARYILDKCLTSARHVKVHIQETEKYGVSLASD